MIFFVIIVITSLIIAPVRVISFLYLHVKFSLECDLDLRITSNLVI